jgi:hypothetical protein
MHVDLAQYVLGAFSDGLVGLTFGLFGGGSILAVPLMVDLVGVPNAHIALGTSALRTWKGEQQTSGRGTFVPLVFGPGESFPFDGSEDWAILAGERTKLPIAHTKLSHSRAFIVRAYPLQTHEMLFDAMTQAFRVLGGVPRRGIFDSAADLRAVPWTDRPPSEDGGRPDRLRQGPAGQHRPVCRHGQPLSVRARVRQSGLGTGEGASREERPGRTLATRAISCTACSMAKTLRSH